MAKTAQFYAKYCCIYTCYMKAWHIAMNMVFHQGLGGCYFYLMSMFVKPWRDIEDHLDLLKNNTVMFHYFSFEAYHYRADLKNLPHMTYLFLPDKRNYQACVQSIFFNTKTPEHFSPLHDGFNII